MRGKIKTNNLPVSGKSYNIILADLGIPTLLSLQLLINRLSDFSLKSFTTLTIPSRIKGKNMLLCALCVSAVNIINRSDDSRGVAGDDGARRYIFRDDAAGADDGVFSNGDS